MSKIRIMLTEFQGKISKKYMIALLVFIFFSPVFSQNVLITKGPYVQNVRNTGAVIMVETNQICSLDIIIVPKGGTAQRRFSGKEKQKIHEIRITELEPDTEYDYKIMLDEKIIDTGSILTKPAKYRGFKFVVYGDTRTQATVHSDTITAIGRESPEFLIHTGDLVNRGSIYEQWGNEFFNPARKLLRNVPVYPCLGNHEEDSKWYYDFFSLPGNEKWYSFDYANSYFIILDCFFGGFHTKRSSQYRWIENELKKAQEYRWIFVTLHSPPYSSGPHSEIDKNGIPLEKEIKVAREIYVPLFKRHNVTMVFAGHDHFYERSRKEDVYYIVTGGGGGPLYDKSAKALNPYSQVFNKSYHYCAIEIAANTLKFKVRDIIGNIIDELEIKK